jgi:multiple sugar transport system substrate-binding protein
VARNPIRTWQMLAGSDEVAYCPFAYGYSNYSREGYAAHRIQTGGLVGFDGIPLRSTLGGAGLAISRRVRHLEEALAYAKFTASSTTQRTIYAQSGGQPGHRSAWIDEALNKSTNNFFKATLQTLDAAWMRPRWPGFIAFQDRASQAVHAYLVKGISESKTLDEMNRALILTREERR